MAVIFFTGRTWLMIFVALCSRPVGASVAPCSSPLAVHSAPVTRCNLVLLPPCLPPFLPWTCQSCWRPPGGGKGEEDTPHGLARPPDAPRQRAGVQALREPVTLCVVCSSFPIPLFLSPSCPPRPSFVFSTPSSIPRGSSFPSPAPTSLWNIREAIRHWCQARNETRCR